MASRKIVIITVAIALAAATVLYFFNPSETNFFPRCPFYVLTGYKCPGCGSLRGIHALLHGHLIEAIRFNLFMVLSIPAIILLLLSPRIRRSVLFARIVLVTVVAWWILRNAF
jgi:hypothetical protein